MSKKNFKLLIMVVFFISCLLTAARQDKFLAVGNVKIVRPEPLVIKREDLNIIIEKDIIKVENLYTFFNKGDYNVKSTFMFWLDQGRYEEKQDFSNKNKNNKGKYIKNIRFYSDYKKSENLRAVIKFDEEIYEGQEFNTIQREWFAVSKIIPSRETGKLAVYYDLLNTDFGKNKQFTFSFDLVNNFNEKNKAEILYINIYNKSNRRIDNILYKGYQFKNLTKKNGKKEHYELLEGNVNLDERLVINFK